MGIIFALIALFSWGIGDFFIQKNTRKDGKLITLFVITAFASIVLLPFVVKDIPILLSDSRVLLLYTATAILDLIVAFLVFQALRIGKLSVIEPLNTVEVPVSVLLAVMLLNETLTLFNLACISFIILGIFFLSSQSLSHIKKIHWERGVILALVANTGMGAVNLLFAVSAREGNPLLIRWYTACFIFLITGGYILLKGRQHGLMEAWKKRKKPLLLVTFFDNAAWIGYCYAVLYLPVSITTVITESYVVVGALLGVLINGERLKLHQWAGLVLSISAAMLLMISL